MSGRLFRRVGVDIHVRDHYVTVGRIPVIVLVLIALSVIGGAVWLVLNTVSGARQSSCVSYERGLRGEAKRGKDGKLVYFNGECWTRQPVAPNDTPF